MGNSLPVWPKTIGKRGQYKMPNGSISRYTITDEIVLQSTQDPTNMLFYWQKLEFETGEVELRLGYYIIGKKPRNLGRWVWGQFCPSMCSADLSTLVDEAKRRNWI